MCCDTPQCFKRDIYGLGFSFCFLRGKVSVSVSVSVWEGFDARDILRGSSEYKFPRLRNVPSHSPYWPSSMKKFGNEKILKFVNVWKWFWPVQKRQKSRNKSSLNHFVLEKNQLTFLGCHTNPRSFNSSKKSSQFTSGSNEPPKKSKNFPSSR